LEKSREASSFAELHEFIMQSFKARRFEIPYDFGETDVHIGNQFHL